MNNIFQSVLFMNEVYRFRSFSDIDRQNVRKNLSYYSKDNESISQFNRICIYIDLSEGKHIPNFIKNKYSSENIERKRCVFAADHNNDILAYYIVDMDNGSYDFEILHNTYRYNQDVKEWLIAKFELRLGIFNKTCSKYYLRRQ